MGNNLMCNCFKRSYTGAETAQACLKMVLAIAYVVAIVYGFVHLEYLKKQVYDYGNFEIRRSGSDYYRIIFLFILGELLFFPRTLLVAGSGWILRLAFGN